MDKFITIVVKGGVVVEVKGLPEGYQYIVDDKDRKTWRYCSLKRAADNPVSEVCDDPLEDKYFDYWSAKAVCGGKNLIATCRREKPLVPGQLLGD